MISGEQSAPLIDAKALEVYFGKSQEDKKNIRLITYTGQDNQEHITLIAKENIGCIETIKGWFGASQASMSNVARVCSTMNIPRELLQELDSSINDYNDSHWGLKQVAPTVQFSIELNLLKAYLKEKIDIKEAKTPKIQERIRILDAITNRQQLNELSKNAYFSDDIVSLFKSAITCNCGIITKRLLKEAPNVIDKDVLLFRASDADSDSNKVIQSLLESGAVNKPHEEVGGLTPLMVASAHGHIKSVKLLLSFPNINLDLKDRENHTALFQAVKNNKLAVVKELLDKGANVQDVYSDPSYSSLMSDQSKPIDQEIITLLSVKYKKEMHVTESRPY